MPRNTFDINIGSGNRFLPTGNKPYVWTNIGPGLLPYIITTWRGITCRIAVTIEGVENPYLPGNVPFQYIGPRALLEMLPADWMSASCDAHCLVGVSQVRAQAREDLSTRLWLTNSIWD